MVITVKCFKIKVQHELPYAYNIPAAYFVSTNVKTLKGTRLTM